MTKRKRKPTSHDEEDEQFDQEGVSFKPSDLWDDNQLVDSWEGVLEEYKRYHSLEAQGIPPDAALEAYDSALAAGATEDEAIAAVFNGNIAENVISLINQGRQLQDDAMGQEDEGEVQDSDAIEKGSVAMELESDADVEEGEATDAPVADTGESTANRPLKVPKVLTTATPSDTKYGASQPSWTPSELGQMMPSTPEGTVKNLMMSWYWAGYYQGLHEGEQKAKAEATDPSGQD